MLSKTFGYVLTQWTEIAVEGGIDFKAVRPPIGLRYLGPTTLRAIKYCSKHGTTEEEGAIPNILFEPVRAVGQIMERAFADTLGLDTALAADNIVKYGTRLAVRPYSTQEGLRIVVGVGLSQVEDTWKPAADLREERHYFIDRYDPLHDPEDTDVGKRREGSVYVPLGSVEGLQSIEDTRFRDMAAFCQGVLPAKVVLGHMQLIEEASVRAR